MLMVSDGVLCLRSRLLVTAADFVSWLASVGGAAQPAALRRLGFLHSFGSNE